MSETFESQSQREAAVVVGRGSLLSLALAEYRWPLHRGSPEQPARRRGAQAACTFMVLKNTLALSCCRRHLVSMLPRKPWSVQRLYGFSEDAVAAAKVIADFAKTNDKLCHR